VGETVQPATWSHPDSFETSTKGRINILKLNITKGRNHEHQSSWTWRFCCTWIVLWLFYYISFAIHQSSRDRQDSISSSDSILRYTRKRKSPINVCCTAVGSWALWGGYKGGANHCVTVCHMTWKLTMFCKQDYIQCIL